MPARTARCECGQLSIELMGEMGGAGVCHCLSCQRRTGSVFAALAGFRPPWTVTGRATEYVRTGDAGASFRFRFCPVCGTNLFHTEEGFEDRGVSVAVGAFADPDFPPPQAPSTTTAATAGSCCRTAASATSATRTERGRGARRGAGSEPYSPPPALAAPPAAAAFAASCSW